MDVTPVVDDGLGNSAYVVDLGDGGALVVDPERDPRPYRAELERLGLSARFVIETHLHADFVSGGRELAAAGAELLAPRGSDLAFTHRPLEDGDEIELGGLTLEVIATPGHTSEHLAYLLRDGSRPVGLFSGGTLMAGGVARPDLLSPEQSEPLARAAYRSITQRLLDLPDDLPVFPTHGGGSFCSAASGGERTTTIGRNGPATRCWSASRTRTPSWPGSWAGSVRTRRTSSSCVTSTVPARRWSGHGRPRCRSCRPASSTPRLPTVRRWWT